MAFCRVRSNRIKLVKFILLTMEDGFWYEDLEFKTGRRRSQKNPKGQREKNPQQVCDLMLKHVLQIQGGLKRVKSQTQ